MSLRRLTSCCLSLALLGACAQKPAEKTDVIVVGSGISGLTAALEAARSGASVRVVEMSSVFGGHAVMAHGGIAVVGTTIQAAAGIEDSRELAESDFLAWGEDASAHWVSSYVERSNEMIFEWLQDLGVEFSDGLYHFPGNSVPRFHNPVGRGLGLVGPIYRACLRQPDIRFVWNAQVDGLLEEGGRVVGVSALGLRSQDRLEFRADHVVLATGGFQSNLEMVREFWPEAYDFPERVLVGSGVHSVGSGHRVAEGAGADLVHMDRQWNYATGLPDPRYPGSDRGLNAHNGAGIWVNQDGERFVNETASTKERFRALLRQDPARFWLLFDARGKRRFWVSGSDWADPKTVERRILSNPAITHRADSIAELARLAGLPVASLEATVVRYNRLLETGEDADFRRFGFGGVPYDLAPFAEEGPLPLAEPPFYALTFFPLARKSMGGVAIDASTRALDAAGEPIPGLYAVGELAGFGGINGWAGLEGTFLGPSILTGRIAGRTIAESIDPRPSGEASEGEPQAATVAYPSELCMNCHDVDRLTAAGRSGYWHFEATHEVVLEAELECHECHGEMFPFRADSHLKDPVAISYTCARCHLAREH